MGTFELEHVKGIFGHMGALFSEGCFANLGTPVFLDIKSEIDIFER